MIIRIELSNVRFYETKAAGKNDGAYLVLNRAKSNSPRSEE